MEKEEILSVDQYTKFLVPASSYNMQDDNRLLIPFTSGDKIGFVDKEGAIVVKPQFTMYYGDCYDERSLLIASMDLFAVEEGLLRINVRCMDLLIIKAKLSSNHHFIV